MEYRLSAREGKARALVVRSNSSLRLYRGLPRPTNLPTTYPPTRADAGKQERRICPGLFTRVWRAFAQVYRICDVSIARVFSTTYVSAIATVSGD